VVGRELTNVGVDLRATPRHATPRRSFAGWSTSLAHNIVDSICR